MQRALFLFILSFSVLAADYIGVDVRSTAELKANPAPGAIHLPMNRLEEATKKLDKEKIIKVFCEAGARAGRAKKKLESLGFKKVENIGSWREWNELSKDKKE